MAARLQWRPQAREDLLEIYETVGVDNPTAATRVLEAIEARSRRLLKHPRLGPRRPEIRRSVRVLVEWPYLILYETRPDTNDGPIDVIEIVRVIHGHRDLLSVL